MGLLEPDARHGDRGRRAGLRRFHDLTSLVAALNDAAAGDVLASEPGLAAFAGVDFLLAVQRAARVGQAQAPAVIAIDCGVMAGAAVEALRGGAEAVIVSDQAAAFASVVEIGAKLGRPVLRA